MVCESCKQTQATVHLTEIVNDQMTELHLCEACANQKGSQVESHFGLADLLSGLADVAKVQEPEEVSTASKTCPTCAMTYEDFRKVGRLGCATCYTTFKRGLGGLLKRIHGSPIHLGKSPVGLVKSSKTKTELKSELTELRRKLERAIEKEAFEEAAALRDQIRRLEQQEPRKRATDG